MENTKYGPKGDLEANYKNEQKIKLLEKRLEDLESRVIPVSAPGVDIEVNLSYDEVMNIFADAISYENYKKFASRKKWIDEIDEITYLDMSSENLTKVTHNSYEIYRTNRDDLMARDWIVFDGWWELKAYKEMRKIDNE